MRGYGLNLHQERFRWDIRKKIVLQEWSNMLPREVLEMLSLGNVKKHEDKALRDTL